MRISGACAAVVTTAHGSAASLAGTTLVEGRVVFTTEVAADGHTVTWLSVHRST